MKWFIPSWNGDFRLEPNANNPDETNLVIHNPTPAESQLLHEFLRDCRKGRRQWLLAGDEKIEKHAGPYRTNMSRTIVLGAPLAKVVPVLVGKLKPRDRTLSALVFKDGRIETAESIGNEALAKLAESASDPDAKAAASIARPTPCCPSCMPGAIEPATEVLVSFLTDDQHADWAEHRAIVVTGGLSGNRYLLAHRHSTIGQRIGRICWDIDDRQVVHFFDHSVPPEEEVLAAKLILEHREPWLRNEATIFGPVQKFKNPFGGFLDGTETSGFLQGFGIGVKA